MTFQKQCKRCLETKDERIDFHWGSQKNYIDATCKKCRNEKAMIYYIRSRGKRPLSDTGQLRKHRHKYANHLFKT